MAACWLLLLFVVFSIQLPLLNTEVYKDYISDHVLVDLQESITTSSVYHAPFTKYDFGQHRSIVIHLHKPATWSLSSVNDLQEMIQKQLAETIFPQSTIPSYLFDRVLRI